MSQLVIGPPRRRKTRSRSVRRAGRSWKMHFFSERLWSFSLSPLFLASRLSGGCCSPPKKPKDRFFEAAAHHQKNERIVFGATENGRRSDFHFVHKRRKKKGEMATEIFLEEKREWRRRWKALIFQHTLKSKKGAASRAAFFCFKWMPVVVSSLLSNGVAELLGLSA